MFFFLHSIQLISQTLSAEPKNCTGADGAIRGPKNECISYFCVFHSTKAECWAQELHRRRWRQQWPADRRYLLFIIPSFHKRWALSPRIAPAPMAPSVARRTNVFLIFCVFHSTNAERWAQELHRRRWRQQWPADRRYLLFIIPSSHKRWALSPRIAPAPMAPAVARRQKVFIIYFSCIPRVFFRRRSRNTRAASRLNFRFRVNSNPTLNPLDLILVMFLASRVNLGLRVVSLTLTLTPSICCILLFHTFSFAGVQRTHARRLRFVSDFGFTQTPTVALTLSIFH